MKTIALFPEIGDISMMAKKKTNKNQLLSSAPTKDELKRQVACYFVCSPGEITLEYPDEIVKNGKTMKGWRWRKQGRRYRFEDKNSREVT